MTFRYDYYDPVQRCFCRFRAEVYMADIGWLCWFHFRKYREQMAEASE